MKFMGVWLSKLFPCCQEETETTLRVLKFEHLDMMYIFEEETQSLKTNLEKLDTKPSLLRALIYYVR